MTSKSCRSRRARTRARRSSPRSGIFRSPRPNLEACIDRPGVDAVILTTPSDQHHDQTLLALSKGKHVQVEIPMALNLADSQHMLDGVEDRPARSAW